MLPIQSDNQEAPYGYKKNGQPRKIRPSGSVNWRQRQKDRTPEHREYYRQYNRKRYSTPDGFAKRRQIRLRNRHGLESWEYNAMLFLQRGVCFICGRVNPGESRKHLAVDHDHNTGRVRALCCDRCNVGMGSFCDNPETIRKAAAYLDHHNAKRSPRQPAVLVGQRPQ